MDKLAASALRHAQVDEQLSEASARLLRHNKGKRSKSTN